MKIGVWTILWSVVVLTFAIFGMIVYFSWLGLVAFGVSLWGVYWGYTHIKRARTIKRQKEGH